MEANIKPSISHHTESLATYHLYRYKNFHRQLSSRHEIAANLWGAAAVEAVFRTAHPERCFSEKLRYDVKVFIDSIGFEAVLDTIESSCNFMIDVNDIITHFRAVCRLKIEHEKTILKIRKDG